MVIIGNINGQMANQLIFFCHFIANSIEHKYALHNPIFRKYLGYFECDERGFEGHPIFVKYPINFSPESVEKTCRRVGRISKHSVVHRYFNYTGETDFDLNDPAFVKDARTRILIVDGWLMRDKAHYHKHAELFRRLFTPKEVHRKAIERHLAPMRQKGTVLIGVHMRRGDYAAWQGGKYYYDDTVYLNQMLHARKAIEAQGKKVVFLVCSNEPVKKESFKDVQLYTGIGSPIEDLYSLAQCDFIVGPPSTYSIWASFYGKTSLFTLKAKDAFPDPDFYLRVK